MPTAIAAFELALTLGLVVLATLSLNLAALTAARWFARERQPAGARPTDGEGITPDVLVQLPLYNEAELVERVLTAVAALDWPQEHLAVQVLDDSTDGSLALSRAAVARWQGAGLRVELLHRSRRTAFKAGALAAGLERSDAPFVAIFDADFIPPADFLRRTVPILLVEPRLALVQARWTHLNATDSLLTRVQARLLDGHFRVEQVARARLGLPVPFNGTCGVWRRAAIDDAGGWQGDTLTEDLDLSIRAHLKGWRSVYLPELKVPGVLPSSPRAWRAQQFRWTKGFVQCFVKLLPQVWASPRLPWWHKLAVSLQMGQPLAFLIGALCLLLGLPFIGGMATAGPVLATVAVLASLLGFLGTGGFLAAGVEPPLRPRHLTEIVAALLLTSGLLLSNARAAFEALVGRQSEFVRTPKRADAGGPPGRDFPPRGLLELSVGVGLLGFGLAEEPANLPFLALVIGGLVGFGAMQILDGRRLGQVGARQRR
jgi:cellulose synthase/poly-beta-1,6-N-acetylglucosamine synthase-like glycosyltransferase